MKNKTLSWWNTKIDSIDFSNLKKAFFNKKFSMGSETIKLEKKLCKIHKAKYCIVTTSGTSALLLSILSLNLKKDDEIILPAHTWIATAQSSTITGNKIKLIDSKVNNPTLDENKIKKIINRKTKVIIPVHFHGHACKMDKILKIAKEKNLTIIEDACKAMHTKYNNKYLGTWGDIGCFSMGMISLISSGYGGFILTNKKSIYEKLLILRDHGMTRKFKDKYLFNSLNFKYSDLLSSIALSQVNKIAIKEKKLKQIYQLYKKGIKNLNKTQILENKSKSPLCIDLVTKNRNQLKKFLHSRNIEISDFHPDLTNAYYLNTAKNLKNSNYFSTHGFMPPCGPNQKINYVKKTIAAIREYDQL
tara:strand:- start:10677 stop:11756 length:1080 start_codon:yes stop_codon:yes gene_type:complete